MNILGLIPARGGSKAIPHKNIAPLAGRPLLAYTCEAARASRCLTRVVLSTDDEQIAEIGCHCGVEAPFLRPRQLARDDTSTVLVAQHAIQWLMKFQDWQTDVLVLLQPTSPLRRTQQIDEAVNLFLQSRADTVVSVVEVPHHYSPYSIMRLVDGFLQDFWQEPLPFDRYRRQNLPVLYARNGPAILVTQVELITEQGSFYGPRVIPYEMAEEDSVDIDTPHDLELAAWLLNRRKQERDCRNA
ncbi:MAG: acylneuraminate cytidylyltransferase family protein [Acidobacteria bacterium]|nr:acylneuraminate cytidylyltransferase family protein [Acidobacteriota bacterium]